MRVGKCGAWMLVLILFGGALAAPAVAATKDWEGEWGEWSATKDGKLRGGSVSIFGCDEATGMCDVRYDNETDEGNCPGDDPGLKLTVSSPTTALLQRVDVDYKQATWRCELALTMSGEGNQRALSARLSGPGCSYYCGRGVATFPDRLPLRNAAPYPSYFDHRQCFADARPSRRALCSDRALQQADKILIDTNLAIADLTRQYDPSGLEALRDRSLAACAAAAAPAACLSDAFAKAVATAEAARRAAQESRDRQDAALDAPGDPAQAKRLLAKLSGVYKERFTGMLVDGTRFPAENILEIVPVGADSFYFRVFLLFYNAHVCDLSGVAHYSSLGIFVYREPGTPDSDAAWCRLQFAVDDHDIRFRDTAGSCRRTCGARGGYDDVAFPLSAKRSIRYLDRLKKSSRFREATAGAPKDPG